MFLELVTVVVLGLKTGQDTIPKTSAGAVSSGNGCITNSAAMIANNFHSLCSDFAVLVSVVFARLWK